MVTCSSYTPACCCVLCVLDIPVVERASETTLAMTGVASPVPADARPQQDTRGVKEAITHQCNDSLIKKKAGFKKTGEFNGMK